MGSYDWTLKTVDSTAGELILEGPIVLFGGKDLTGEFFTPRTVFESGYTATGRLAIDWEHGLQPDRDDQGRPIPQPGKDDVLGWLDWTTKRMDDIGLLARYVLDRRLRYVNQFVEPLARAALLGSSSEAIPERIVKQRDGRIDAWPLRRQTLTVTPAEPRILTTHQLAVVKSLEPMMPGLKTAILGRMVWGTPRWRQMLGLMDDVAQHLTGRWVNVRPRAPYSEGALAAMMPTAKGGAVIDIDPDLDAVTAYESFLHEVGHIRLDYQPVIESKTVSLPPRSVERDWSRSYDAEHRKREQYVSLQAAYWDRWAAGKVGHLKSVTGDPILNRLMALRTIQVYRRGE